MLKRLPHPADGECLSTLDDAGLFASDSLRRCLEALHEPGGGVELLAAEIVGLLRDAAGIERSVLWGALHSPSGPYFRSSRSRRSAPPASSASTARCSRPPRDRRHGTRPATEEEIEAQLGRLPRDGEG